MTVDAVAAVVAGALFGYLIGSISPGLLIGRLYGVDVRDFGSGKTGFTNTLRSVGVLPAIVVITADILKGTAAVLVGSQLLDEPWAAALGGIAVVAGHNWPLFTGFRGGRGVATAFGAFMAIDPVAGMLVLAASTLILAATRYMSLVSVTAVLAGAIILVVRALSDVVPMEYIAFGVVVATTIEVSHIGNIRRLTAGEEPKLGQGGSRRQQSET
ncbi:MAG TPA: glycerol-3-phosphate 1-O-acyltransferase PlsY [Dehalococcoidia bacterium]|jgi:glycerol-3-phosphate acyltransferase PlsY|nr:glycerol-3-phosphate 1-O-acyltransferase PlsY [Dehalococcoidia bacterium]